MTGRCLTCKHWEPPDVVMGDKAGHCRRAESRHGEHTSKKSLMWASDAEGYLAWLCTLPEFGCVMHEEREG